MIPKLASYELPKSEEIPRGRVDWPLEPAKAALLIHDMQDYFLDFWGEDSPFTKSLVQNIQRLKEFCKLRDIPVYYTAQPAEQSPEDRALLNDMWGPGIATRPHRKNVTKALEPQENDIVLTKWRYSAFQRSNLEELLKKSGRTQLIICGVYAHIGCMTTALDAFMRDIKPFLVADALADFSREKHITALEIVAGSCGRVIKLDNVVGGLPQSIEELREQVLVLLDDEDEAPENDENLVDFGLDSVQIMATAAKWQKIKPEIDFIKLAQNPSITYWWSLLQD